MCPSHSTGDNLTHFQQIIKGLRPWVGGRGHPPTPHRETRTTPPPQGEARGATLPLASSWPSELLSAATGCCSAATDPPGQQARFCPAARARPVAPPQKTLRNERGSWGGGPASKAWLTTGPRPDSLEDSSHRVHTQPATASALWDHPCHLGDITSQHRSLPRTPAPLNSCPPHFSPWCHTYPTP